MPEDHCESNSLFEQFADPRIRDLFDLHLWTMREGLRGASAKEMFLEYCRRLVARGVSLSRGHMSTRTLHPQWRGYGYSWRRDQDLVEFTTLPAKMAPMTGSVRHSTLSSRARLKERTTRSSENGSTT